MERTTGLYRTTDLGGEQVRAFVPFPLPPERPPLLIDDPMRVLLDRAQSAIGRLDVAGKMVPSANWFLHGFVRKEAVISSQIEGTQATLRDVLHFEATRQSLLPEDVEDVCNYVDALTYARGEIVRPGGLPLSNRLLCGAHQRLMHGARGSEKTPGHVRTSQNWIGGTRPGNAIFVPPPADEVPGALASLEQWIHNEASLAPLIRIGLAHVQFETIHPFLDGNGRIGRLLVALLVEHWGLLDSPLLYISLPLKRRREEYYWRLASVRSEGDWEGWLMFFLECVCEAADDGVQTAGKMFSQLNEDRRRLLDGSGATVSAIRLFERLPETPVVTLASAMELLQTTKPTATSAIETLVKTGVLRETSGRKRDRVYAYHHYLAILASDTELA
ncbi:MAG: Fic family protein [Planctomycetaceae bacterium]|nr:MAG: Fic family protein [Planctomycetaceae bacterium]